MEEVLGKTAVDTTKRFLDGPPCIPPQKKITMKKQMVDFNCVKKERKKERKRKRRGNAIRALCDADGRGVGDVDVEGDGNALSDGDVLDAAKKIECN